MSRARARLAALGLAWLSLAGAAPALAQQAAMVAPAPVAIPWPGEIPGADPMVFLLFSGLRQYFVKLDAYRVVVPVDSATQVYQVDSLASDPTEFRVHVARERGPRSITEKIVFSSGSQPAGGVIIRRYGEGLVETPDRALLAFKLPPIGDCERWEADIPDVRVTLRFERRADGMRGVFFFDGLSIVLTDLVRPGRGIRTWEYRDGESGLKLQSQLVRKFGDTWERHFFNGESPVDPSTASDLQNGVFTSLIVQIGAQLALDYVTNRGWPAVDPPSPVGAPSPSE